MGFLTTLGAEPPEPAFTCPAAAAPKRPAWRPPGELSAEPRGEIRRLPRFVDGGDIPPEPADHVELNEWRAAVAARAAAGCRAAADALVRSFESDVRRAAERNPDPDAAVQAGLLAVLTAVRSYDPDGAGTFTAYALSAARRAMRQLGWTWTARRGVRSLDRVVGDGEGRGCRLAALVEDVAALPPDERAAAKELWAALARLSPNERSVLASRMRGLTFKEAAAAAGLSTGAVHPIERRAVARLAAAVGEDEPEEPRHVRHDPPPVPPVLLATLKPNQRFAIEGRQAGRTYDDLAAERGVTAPCVRRAYLRAMRSLGGAFTRDLGRMPR